MLAVGTKRESVSGELVVYGRGVVPGPALCEAAPPQQRGLPWTPYPSLGLGGRGWRSDLNCEGKEETCPVQYRFYKSCPRPQKETEDKTEGRGRPAPPPS